MKISGAGDGLSDGGLGSVLPHDAVWARGISLFVIVRRRHNHVRSSAISATKMCITS